MDSTADAAAVLAVIISLVVAGFQAYWASGRTRWLAEAWGGAYTELPPRLRIGSAVSTLVFIIAAALVLARADYWELSVSFEVVKWGTWVFAVVFLLSSFANFASSSKWERYLNGPSSLALAGLFLIVARSAQPG